ncbi:hypothetical protein [Streptomyces albidoflavus]|uniref:hypothetical protein n=1 Tax=Streptomyces albidoflavus TaxID=1886 RepID=UPI0033D1F46A
MRITADHVKELATLFGETVLVPMPEKAGPPADLWVISTGNKHYDGAATVYATGEQVEEMITDADYDEDGSLTDAAAWRIADELNDRDRNDARASAYTLQYADGFTGRVMDAMRADD